LKTARVLEGNCDWNREVGWGTEKEREAEKGRQKIRSRSLSFERGGPLREKKSIKIVTKASYRIVVEAGGVDEQSHVNSVGQVSRSNLQEIKKGKEGKDGERLIQAETK